jgi:hypothetical protein
MRRPLSHWTRRLFGPAAVVLAVASPMTRGLAMDVWEASTADGAWISQLAY